MGLVRKNILVTGAGRGLGLELSRYFWDRGANVFLVGRDIDHLHRALDGLTVRHGQSAAYFQCDLADDSAITALVSKLSETRLDAVVNNAAIQGPIGSLPDNDWQEWKDTIQVNLLAPVLLCKTLLPRLLSQDSDVSIINLSGGGATGPRPNFTAYATAKTGLVRFSETLAEELKESRIRVNCIAPGPMKTDMLKSVLDAGNAGIKEVAAAEKAFAASASPFDRVAALCEYLISDEAKGITGKLISAVWDPFEDFNKSLSSSDIGTLRRIVPEDRGSTWDELTRH